VAAHLPAGGANLQELKLRAQQLEQAAEIPIVRRHPGRETAFDAKSSLASLSVCEEDGHPVVRMRIRLLTTSQIRPNDVLELLAPHVDVKDVLLVREGFELENF
jgi:hypothetical protein